MSTYRFLGKIGEGGMAEVFSAVQEDLERPVAIKMVKPWLATDADFIARFQQEAKTLAAMHHEGLVRVFDLGKQDDRPYLVMEKLQGCTLHARLHPKRDQPAAPMSEREAVRIASHVLTALVYAHERHNVVHRDIKPANVFLCDETQGYQVKLMDFGIASLLDGPRVTRTGEQFGTPEYMCPEQIEGKKPTPQWDLYGVGILLYEMVCGDVPFKADTPIAIAHKHLSAPVPPLPTNLSPQLRAVIVKALVKDPMFRFGSAREMLAALRGEIVLVPPPVADAPVGLANPQALPKTPAPTRIPAPGAVRTLAPTGKRVRKPRRQLNFNVVLLLVALFSFLSVSGVMAFIILRTAKNAPASTKKKTKAPTKTTASGKSSRHRSVTKSSRQRAIPVDPVANERTPPPDEGTDKQKSQDSENPNPSGDAAADQDPKETGDKGEEPANSHTEDPPASGEEPTKQTPPE